MKHQFEVCLVAAALATGFTSVHAQVPPMQKGISVGLPVTHHAVPMPNADQEDSLIVSVTEDGSLYLGVDPVDRVKLADKLKEQLANQTNQRLYIKADARTAYANVLKVLVELRAAGVDAPIFLTAQRDAADLKGLVPPKGLEVQTGPSGAEPVVVRLLDSGSKSTELMVGGQRVPWEALLSTLDQHLQHQRERAVQVKADGILPFAAVMHAFDVCRSAGAKVVVVTSGL